MSLLLSTLTLALSSVLPASAQWRHSPDLAVAVISSSAIAAAAARRDKVLLFDVRGSDEFAVSRLRGAKRISAETEEDRATFLARLGNVTAAIIVFYCTTSVRSTDFAQGVLHELLARGAKGVFVLNGGIIAWHNEGRPLVNFRGATRHVHPFNDEMKQHLRRPELARMRHNNVRRKR